MSKPRTGAPKRVGVGLLAGALALAGVALAPSAGATSNVTVTRLAGATRYGTAAAIAGHQEFTSPKTAIVATGENFPDALAASGLAGANAPAPIVLTQKDTYTADAKSALASLKSKGVSAVTLVGGTAAVSDTVKNAIAADGFTVTRVAGADRYATAAAIATAMGTVGTVAGNKTALIATGENFPDALAGGPAAYDSNLPILLVNTNSIPAATSSAISSLGIKHAVILGGTAVVSDSVKSQLDSATGSVSDRLAGTDRYGTAAAVGTWEKGTLGFALSNVIAATGLNFPDALAAGPLGGELEAPIVLTASCPQPTTDFLKANADTIDQIILSGGTAVIDQATADCLKAAATGTGNSTATSRPELVSASIVKTVTNGTLDNPAGTTVRFVFDEPVNNPDAGSFDLYTTDPDNNIYGGDDASVPTANDHAVDVLYTGLTEAADLTGVVLGGVQFDAVTDAGGNENPEGSAPIGNAPSSSITAGRTTAPDLVSVSRVGSPAETAGVNQRAVDFTFDQKAFTTAGDDVTDNFQLVLTDGSLVQCNGPGTANSADAGSGDPGGNGTTTITTLCDAVQDDNGTSTFTSVSLSNIARGIVDDGAVTSNDAGDNPNPLEASDTPDGDASNAPDLVSVTFKHGTSKDTAVYTFDRTILDPGSDTGFHAYDSSGNDITPNGDTPVLSPDSKSLEVHFDSGDLDSAAGGIVDAGTVTPASGTNTQDNLDDEEGAASTGTTASTAGSTISPDLTAVIVATTKDSFGQVTNVTIVYTFDENIAPTAGSVQLGALGNFWAFTANGDRMACAYGATTDDSDLIPANSVACDVGAGAVIWDPFGESGTHTGGSAVTLSEAQGVVLGTITDGAVEDSAGNWSPEAGKTATPFGA